MEALIASKAIIVFGVFALLFAGERLAGFARQPQQGADKRGRLIRNVGLWLLTVPVSPLIIIPITAFAASHALWQRPDWWSGAAGLALDILLLDLWIYWMHRAFHRVPFLWRFHEIHHRDGFLDATSAFRFHFAEVILSASVRAAFIVALAMPLSSVIVFETFAAVIVTLHHSNIRLPRWLERPLSFVIITPSIHWVHHHVIRSDTNSNYGTIFSFWDPLFGTRSVTQRTADLPIGLDDAGDISLGGLIVQPFRGPFLFWGRRTGEE